MNAGCMHVHSTWTLCALISWFLRFLDTLCVKFLILSAYQDEMEDENELIQHKINGATCTERECVCVCVKERGNCG